MLGYCLVNVIIVFFFSNYVWKVFIYIFGEKYWLDGNKMIIFAFFGV